MSEKKMIAVGPEEHGILINGMLHYRNDLLSKDIPVEDVNDLIDDIINAPTKKEMKHQSREAR